MAGDTPEGDSPWKYSYKFMWNDSNGDYHSYYHDDFSKIEAIARFEKETGKDMTRDHVSVARLK